MQVQGRIFLSLFLTLANLALIALTGETAEFMPSELQSTQPLWEILAQRFRRENSCAVLWSNCFAAKSTNVYLAGSHFTTYSYCVPHGQIILRVRVHI